VIAFMNKNVIIYIFSVYEDILLLLR
jgi:hypothetical protein